MVSTPLVSPGRYFADRANPMPAGSGVFVLFVVAELIAVTILWNHLLAQVESPTSEVERAFDSGLGIVVVSALVGFVVAWLVVAAVMHYGSGGASTAGSFTDALAVAGWAYAPNLLATPVNHWYTHREIGRLSFDGSDVGRLATEFEAAEAAIALHPLQIALFLVVTAWSVYILAYGVSETHDVPTGAAALPAIVVGVGSIVLTVLG